MKIAKITKNKALLICRRILWAFSYGRILSETTTVYTNHKIAIKSPQYILRLKNDRRILTMIFIAKKTKRYTAFKFLIFSVTF